jgi:hypothetical protein
MIFVRQKSFISPVSPALLLDDSDDSIIRALVYESAGLPCRYHATMVSMLI